MQQEIARAHAPVVPSEGGNARLAVDGGYAQLGRAVPIPWASKDQAMLRAADDDAFDLFHDVLLGRLGRSHLHPSRSQAMGLW